MDTVLVRAMELKQSLSDFVYDAEGDIAIALESAVAGQLARSAAKDTKQRDMAVDIFLTRGQVGTQTPLALFIQSNPQLLPSDRALIQSWHRSFNGLFVVQQGARDRVKLMNWLTAKSYDVKTETLFKPGEILLTRLAPLEADWMFLSPVVQLGSLGKPKLAVAIGNFKQSYKFDLYGDAPDLLEAAWASVERYHQDFLDFFGGSKLTLSGYELSKKLPEFQDFITQRRLDEVGIDQNKSLSELAAEAGVSAKEISENINEMAEALGIDADAAAKMMHNKAAAKMVTPQVELPPDLKKAERVTLLAHPRWGQMILPTYGTLIDLLNSENWQDNQATPALMRKAIADPEMNAYVWHGIAEQYPIALEKVLQAVLQRPDFVLTRDLDGLLQAHHKLLEPELPEIASVPLHLHTLFQEALAEVSKTKSKPTQKAAKGFRR